MEPTRNNNPFAFPPALMTQLEIAADGLHRPVADVVRALVEQGLQELQRARELGLPDDDQPLTDEYRQTLREEIAQGVASARAGKFVDGEAVFARIRAEMLTGLSSEKNFR